MIITLGTPEQVRVVEQFGVKYKGSFLAESVRMKMLTVDEALAWIDERLKMTNKGSVREEYTVAIILDYDDTVGRA